MTASEFGPISFTTLKSRWDSRIAVRNAKEDIEKDSHLDRDGLNVVEMLTYLDHPREFGVLIELEFDQQNAEFLAKR